MDKTVIDILEKAVDDGFLLHGSNKNIPELIPQQAFDLKGRKANRRVTYATSQPEAALWFATLGARHHRNSYRPGFRRIEKWSFKRQHALRTSLRDTDITFAITSKEGIADRGSGFVYILASDSFDIETGGPQYSVWEYCSEEKVTPIKVLPVEKEDFPFPIIEVSTEDEFGYFETDPFVGFGNGVDIHVVYINLPNGKKLLCRVREIGIPQIKNMLKNKSPRKLSVISKLNLALINFQFIDDIHGEIPDFKNKKLPISFLQDRDLPVLLDVAYPLYKQI